MLKGIVILLLVGCIYHAHGLECYSCFFHKNIPAEWFGLIILPSDADCEEKPKNTMTCGGRLNTETQADSGSLLKHKFGSSHHVNMSTNGEGETFQGTKPLCYTHQLKIGDMLMMERGCDYFQANIPEDCSTFKMIDPILGNDVEVTDCLCGKDKCNGGQVVQISTFLALAFIVVHYGIC